MADITTRKDEHDEQREEAFHLQCNVRSQPRRTGDSVFETDIIEALRCDGRFGSSFLFVGSLTAVYCRGDQKHHRIECDEEH
jgi:hypothetical protein